jgi:hypothetical protein
MSSFVKSLLSARSELMAEFNQAVVQLEKRLGHLDALLSENGVDMATLPSTSNPGKAPGKKRGRKPGSGKAAAAAAVTKDPAEAKAPKAGKKTRKPRNKSGINVTAAVRGVVAEIKSPFNISTLRDEFEKRHPGVLATLNRVALSLAMQSLGRKGEVSSKKDPNGKGNLFAKTSKLKA